jgi:hypothetical protein
MALQYAVPNGTNPAGTWSVVPSGTHHEATDEYPATDDSDYITTTADADTIVFALSSVSTPGAGNRTIRIRAQSAGSNPAERLDVDLLENGSLVERFNNQSVNRGSWAEMSMSVTAAISDYSALSISITSNSAETYEISYVVFEVPDGGGTPRDRRRPLTTRQNLKPALTWRMNRSRVPWVL